jgi:hypothetical protein
VNYLQPLDKLELRSTIYKVLQPHFLVVKKDASQALVACQSAAEELMRLLDAALSNSTIKEANVLADKKGEANKPKVGGH